MYERLRHPLRLCREYALEDGRKWRDAAAASARKRQYAEARSQLEDARLCFDWAGNTAEDLRELENVEGELKVANCSIETAAVALRLIPKKVGLHAYSKTSTSGPQSCYSTVSRKKDPPGVLTKVG